MKMDLTPEEILKVKTKGTLRIIEDSPLHKAVISAMKYYTEQEVKKALTGLTPKVYEWISLPPFNLEHAQHGVACEKFTEIRNNYILNIATSK
jgi:hypothetical protein